VTHTAPTTSPGQNGIFARSLSYNSSLARIFCLRFFPLDFLDFFLDFRFAFLDFFFDFLAFCFVWGLSTVLVVKRVSKEHTRTAQKYNEPKQ